MLKKNECIHHWILETPSPKHGSDNKLNGTCKKCNTQSNDFQAFEDPNGAQKYIRNRDSLSTVNIKREKAEINTKKYEVKVTDIPIKRKKKRSVGYSKTDLKENLFEVLIKAFPDKKIPKGWISKNLTSQTTAYIVVKENNFIIGKSKVLSESHNLILQELFKISNAHREFPHGALTKISNTLNIGLSVVARFAHKNDFKRFSREREILGLLKKSFPDKIIYRGDLIDFYHHRGYAYTIAKKHNYIFINKFRD